MGTYQTLRKHLDLDDLDPTVADRLREGVSLSYDQTVAAIRAYFKGTKTIGDPCGVIGERIERADQVRQRGHDFVMRYHRGLCDLHDETAVHPTFDPINDIYVDDAVDLLREIGVQI